MEEYFVIDANGKELPLGHHDRLGNISNGWLRVTSEHKTGFGNIHPAETWLIFVPTMQKILFPLRGNIVLGIDENEQVFHVGIDTENRWKENSKGVWSLRENKPILSGSYAEIYYRHAEKEYYVVKDCKGHVQLRGKGDVLLDDYGAIEGAYRWHRPSADDPILLVSSETNHEGWRAFNLNQGKLVGPAFRAIGKFCEGRRYMRTLDDRHLLVDSEWNPIVEFPYAPYIGGLGADTDPISNIVCQDGVIAVECENFSYLLGCDGEVVIPPKKHKYIFSVGGNRVIVSKGTRFALADTNGLLFSDFLYRAGDKYTQYFNYSFSENRLAIRKQIDKKVCKYGFLDSNGNEAVPFIYDMIPLPGHFSHGCTVVGIENV